MLRSLLAPGIRTKVFLLSLVLLGIPWIGYEYIWQIEKFQREGQERALMGTARAVATALHDRPQLFVRSTPPSRSEERSVTLVVPPLDAAIRLDGKTDDWPPAEPQRATPLPAAAGTPLATWHGATSSVTSQLGRFGQFLYLQFVVQDDKVVVRNQESSPLLHADHVRLAWVTPAGTFQRYVVPIAQGRLPVYAQNASAQGALAPDKEIDAYAALATGGYVVEIRVPLSRIGRALSFEVADVDDAASGTIESVLGVAGTEREDQLLPVQIPETEVAQILRGLAHTTSRIFVVDASAHVLAQTGSLRESAADKPNATPQESLLARWWARFEHATLRHAYERVLPQPSEVFADDRANPAQMSGEDIAGALRGDPTNRWRATRDGSTVIMSAAHPIWNGDRVAGAVLVEETTNATMALRNQALEALFNTTLAVFLLGTGSLFLFASRLSSRIRKLRDEAEHAVDSHGRVQQLIAGSANRDEIGDLSRSFSSLLTKLSEHSKYLESMASRMSHELRTPIAVVRSSLDNLRLQPLPNDARVYMDRAQDGLVRLNSIVTSMSEATRLEHALQGVEKERFDLGEVVAGCVAGYSSVYTSHAFFMSKPPEPLIVEGAPELIAQLLDKLASNAVDFSAHGSTIEITLRREEHHAVLRVVNEGPPLPDAIRDRLFQSMVSMRNDGGSAPHLGLGLYVVRLIAEFHGARVAAHNRNEPSGVEIRLDIPLAKSPAN